MTTALCATPSRCNHVGRLGSGRPRLEPTTFEQAEGADHKRRDAADSGRVDLGDEGGALDIQHQGRTAQRHRRLTGVGSREYEERGIEPGDA